MAEFLLWLSSKFPHRDICRENGVLYLRRFKLYGWMPDNDKKFPINVYLHRIYLADEDEAPHSHPWKWAVSFILSGSYLEVRILEKNETEVLRSSRKWISRFNFLMGDTFHLIKEVSIEPVWTLFITGPKVSGWGFFEGNRGFIPWRKRLTERGIPLPY